MKIKKMRGLIMTTDRSASHRNSLSIKANEFADYDSLFELIALRLRQSILASSRMRNCP